MGAYYDSIIKATAGLLDYYPMNEVGGTTAIDAVGSKNGTYTGTFSLRQQTTPGPSVFSNGALEIVTASPWTTSNSNVTMEAWAYFTSVATANQTIFYNGNSGANGYGLYWNNTANKWTAQCGGSGFATLSNAAPVNNTWYHLVLTLTGTSQWQLSINAVAGTQVTKATVAPSGNSFWFAQGGVGFPTFGNMVGMAVYSGVLSGATITAHHNAGLVPDFSGAGIMLAHLYQRPRPGVWRRLPRKWREWWQEEKERRGRYYPSPAPASICP